MFNSWKEREGPVYSEKVWVNIDDSPEEVLLVGDESSVEVFFEGKRISEGKLDFLPTQDAGRPTRTTVFVPNEKDSEIGTFFVREDYLTGDTSDLGKS